MRAAFSAQLHCTMRGFFTLLYIHLASVSCYVLDNVQNSPNLYLVHILGAWVIVTEILSTKAYFPKIQVIMSTALFYWIYMQDVFDLIVLDPCKQSLLQLLKPMCRPCGILLWNSSESSWMQPNAANSISSYSVAVSQSFLDILT